MIESNKFKMINGIMKISGVRYKILMHLFKSPNPKENYANKIRIKINCTSSVICNCAKTLEAIKLMTFKKVGNIKYLQLTKKGKNVAEILYKVIRNLE